MPTSPTTGQLIRALKTLSASYASCGKRRPGTSGWTIMTCKTTNGTRLNLYGWFSSHNLPLTSFDRIFLRFSVVVKCRKDSAKIQQVARQIPKLIVTFVGSCHGEAVVTALAVNRKRLVNSKLALPRVWTENSAIQQFEPQKFLCFVHTMVHVFRKRDSLREGIFCSSVPSSPFVFGHALFWLWTFTPFGCFQHHFTASHCQLVEIRGPQHCAWKIQRCFAWGRWGKFLCKKPLHQPIAWGTSRTDMSEVFFFRCTRSNWPQLKSSGWKHPNRRSMRGVSRDNLGSRFRAKWGSCERLKLFLFSNGLQELWEASGKEMTIVAEQF